MKAWLVGVSATALLAAGFYLAAPKPAEPIPLAPAPEAIAAAPVQPPATLTPAILDRVTDVTDIDHLLEPPPIPTSTAPPGPVITRVGYEEPVAPKPTTSDVPPIPKSAPDEPRIIIQAEEEITRTEEEGMPILYQPGDGLVFPLPSWEDEFRNGNAIPPRPIPLELDPKPAFLEYGTFRNLDKPRYKWDPTTTKDSDLFKTVPESLTFEPLQETGRQRESVVRTYALFDVLHQQPASRLEWFTRWHGDAPLPVHAGLPLTQKHFLERFDLNRFWHTPASVGMFF